MCLDSSSGKMRKQQMFEAQEAEKTRQQMAEQAEQQRQMLLNQANQQKANITAGNSAIDNAFAGFNDDYYSQAAKRYTDAYNPQIDYQAGQALDKLKASLAGRGLLESSVGAKAIADLSQQTADARVKVANDAFGFTNGIRSKVADARNTLSQQNMAAADPSAIATNAISSATSLANQGSVAPTTPLGDMFGAFLTPFISASQAAQNSFMGGRPKEEVKTPSLGTTGSSYTRRS